MKDLAGTMLGISLQRLLHTQTTLYSQKRWRNGPKTWKLLPCHFEIIEDIDKRFKEMIHATRKDMAGKLSGMQILDNSNPQKPVVRMANLCVVSCHTWMFWVLSRRWVRSVATHNFSEKIKWRLWLMHEIVDNFIKKKEALLNYLLFIGRPFA